MDLAKLSDRVAKQLLTLEADYEKEIALSLRDALNQMRGEMARIYEKYATAGKLTKAEMTRYNRYATMEKQMLAALNPALKANLRTIRRLTPEQYEASFFRYAWSVDQSTGLRLAWGNVNKAQIAAALASEYSKISLERYGLDARMAIRSALNNGLSLGKSYAQMASDLKHAINTTNFKASRIVRTEGQYAVNAGQSAAYEKAVENGVQGKPRWQSTLDNRTRPDHQIMDGQEKDEEGLYHLPDGQTTPYPVWEGLPADQRCQCRCREILVIEGYEPQLRRTRGEGVIPYQNYTEWKEGLNARGRSA